MSAAAPEATVKDSYVDQLHGRLQSYSQRVLTRAWVRLDDGLTSWVENAPPEVFQSPASLANAAWAHVTDNATDFGAFYALPPTDQDSVQAQLAKCATIAINGKQPAAGVIDHHGEVHHLSKVDYVPVDVDTSIPKWTSSVNDSPRTLSGTLVLGPSGSGKTVFMAKGVAAELAMKTGLSSPDAVVTIYAMLEELQGCNDKPDVSQLRGGIAALLANLTSKLSFKDKYVVICVDEIGVSPGLLFQPSTWESLMATSHDTLTREDVGARGVHIVAGGTAAELRDRALASNCKTVRKIRLKQWTLDQVLLLWNQQLRTAEQIKQMKKLKIVLPQLCAVSPGLRAAVTNPRMARILLAQMSPNFLQRAVANENDADVADVDYLAAQQAWLVHQVVREYVEMNGLQSLSAGASEHQKLRGVMRGVAAGALRVCMRQRTQDVQKGRAAVAESLDDICVRAAEHFGLLTSNWKATGTVEPGHLQYEMHAGTVLVALHLAGLKVAEMSSTWTALEELTGLALLFEAVSEVSLEATDVQGALQDSVPRALRDQRLPYCAVPLRPLHWDSVTQPGERQLVSSATSTTEESAFCVMLPEGPTAVLAQEKAQTPDVFGYRCLAQCKYTAPDTIRPKKAGIHEELVKSGLLTDSTDDQKDILGALTHWWASFTPTGNGKRAAADFWPGTSMMGPRHMYPLSLIMATGRSRGSTSDTGPLQCWTSTSEHPFLTRADPAESSSHQTTNVAGKTAVPSPPVAQPGATSEAEGPDLGTEHTAWCEFRFVTTDVRKLLGEAVKNVSGTSRTLAIFVRRTAEDPEWRMVHGSTERRGLQNVLPNVLRQLRTDIPLTLVAITVCHVCDHTQLASLLQQPTDTEESHGKRTRGKGQVDEATAPNRVQPPPPPSHQEGTQTKKPTATAGRAVKAATKRKPQEGGGAPSKKERATRHQNTPAGKKG